MRKCKYLVENEGKTEFDEIAECPRFLNHEEQVVLLSSLATGLVEFGNDLDLFVSNYQDSEVDLSDFFDFYYRPLYSDYFRARRAIENCRTITYTRFCGKDY